MNKNIGEEHTQYINAQLEQLMEEVKLRTKAVISGVKIPDLPEQQAVDGTELLVVENKSGTHKVSISNFPIKEVVDARNKDVTTNYTSLKQRLDASDDMVKNTFTTALNNSAKINNLVLELNDSKRPFNTLKEKLDDVSDTITNIQNSTGQILDNSKQYTDEAIKDLIGTAPDTLNSINELAQALNGDPDFGNKIIAQLATKVEKDYVDNQLDLKADVLHEHSSQEIVKMSGYLKPSNTEAIEESDSLNEAIGKLERAIDDKQASGDYLTKNGGELTGSLTAPNFIGTLTGNADTSTVANKLKESRDITLKNDVSGVIRFDGSSDVEVTTELSATGVAADTYGLNADINTNIIKIPQITVDSKGRITNAETTTVTIPVGTGGGTDTKVMNTLNKTTKAYITGTTSNRNEAGEQVFDDGVFLDVGEGHLTATQFNGELNGNASTATQLKNKVKINGVDFDGTGNIDIFDNTKETPAEAQKKADEAYEKAILHTDAKIDEINMLLSATIKFREV